MRLELPAVRIALMLLLASTMAIADDEIFRCEGKDGVTVFASKPCGPDATPVSVAPPPPGAAVSGINIEPKAAAVPGANLPATSALTPAQMERLARTEADTATADCSKVVRLLETRLHEIERRDYGL